MSNLHLSAIGRRISRLSFFMADKKGEKSKRNNEGRTLRESAVRSGFVSIERRTSA